MRGVQVLLKWILVHENWVLMSVYIKNAFVWNVTPCTMVEILILKIRISQNTSIYCQYLSWQLCSHHQTNIVPCPYTDCYLHTYSYDLANTWTILWYPLQLCCSCCSVEFYCIYYCFMACVLFCKHFWDPKHVHYDVIYLREYGSVWPDDDSIYE
jgi:hypothetical protein